MSFLETKSKWASKGVWGGLVAAAAGVAGLSGYVDAAASIVSIAGGALAAIGRITATKAVR